MSQVKQTGRFLRRWWPVVLAAAVMALIASFVALVWFIHIGARNYAEEARQQYPGDEVEALTRAIADEHRTVRDRNHAVWALGQLRDPRGLPVLRRHYADERCRVDKCLSRYELKKAIDLCTGRTSAPRWLQKAIGWALPQVRTGA